MTDKLADDCRMAFENYWCEIGMRRAMPFWKDTDTDGKYVDRKMADAWRHWQSAWNTRHEATKDATSDDVMDAVSLLHTAQTALTMYGQSDLALDLNRVHAALRNTQGVPSEVVDEVRGLLKNCQYVPSGHDEAASALCGYMEQAISLLDQHARGG